MFSEVPSEVLEGSLAYKVDLNPFLHDLKHNSSCNELWTPSRNATAANFTYSDLSGSCRLSAEVTGNYVERKGSLGIFLVLNNDTVVSKWTTDLNITYHRKTTDTEATYVWVATAIEGVSLHGVNAPPSSIQFFNDNLFKTATRSLIFQAGQNVWVRHTLDNFNNFSEHLQLNWVAMSRSSDPENVKMVLQDLTGTVKKQGTFPGGTQFEVALPACYDCFFHVSSLITHEDRNRRLSDEETTGAVVAIIVQKPGVDGTIAYSLWAVSVWLFLLVTGNTF